MSGVKEKLGDLSWLGPEYADKGWVEVDETVTSIQSSPAEIAWQKAKDLLRESDWSVLPDVPMINEQRQEWIAYRAELRNVRSQQGFPENITWPIKPE